jgi:hypothetical protein
VSRLFATVLTALLLFAAVPASAQETTEPVEESVEEPEVIACENPDGLEVITPEGLQTDIATPSFLVGNEVETKDLLVDLSATSLDATATVLVGMTWNLIVNDYDLQAYSASGGGVSENYQPFDPVEESVNLTKVKHCEVITAAAIDFLAPVVVDSLVLDFRVSKIVDPGPAPVESTTTIDSALVEALLAP